VDFEFATVVVKKAADVLAARLREVILAHGLAEGTPLPTESELVDQSGLSRASVREALRVLGIEGLVQTKVGRNGGSQVRRPGQESISRTLELFVRSHGVSLEALLEAREAIEPAAARLAALYRSENDLAEMTRIHQEFEAISDDATAHKRLNLEWHRAVVKAGGNEPLIAFFNAIADSINAVAESHSVFSPDVHREVVRVHGSLLAAIAAREPDAAFRRMQGHVGTYSSLVKQLDKSGTTASSRSNQETEVRRTR
jgi:GntR family transcriptional repressor for pyruvate dehydrogenase complex